MIIYSLSKYRDEQLQPLSDHIIDFLKVLERGKNVEINNLCNTMLKHFTGNEEENDNENDENGNENFVHPQGAPTSPILTNADWRPVITFWTFPI